MTSSSPPSSGRRVLVTGGAGFIGSHLVDLLVARGDHVVVIDNLSTGRIENLGGMSNTPLNRPNVTFHHCTVSEALRDMAGREQFDQIYHLAAAVGVRLVVEQPIRSIETNVGESSALLAFATMHGRGGSGAPTLIASSSEVYGKAEKSPFAEDDDVMYGPTTRSRWSYAASKAIDEYLTLAYHQQHALPGVVARFFNTVGPRQVGAYGMVLPNFVAAALKGQDLVIYGDGKQSRCFCDVRDVVSALPSLLETPGCAGRVFNVGSDRSVTIEGLADLVCRTLSSRSGKRFIPYDQAYTAGFEDLRQRQPDLTRIRAAIGFVPKRSLEQTIRELADWMQAERPISK